MSTGYRIADVVVVDPRDGTLTPHQDVTVQGERIVDVGTSSGPPGRDDVDGRGRFAVPGYVDMHAHPLGRKDPTGALRLMLAFGITGYRQMAGSPGLLARRRAGTLDFGPNTPRLVALPGDLLTPMNAGTPEAAAAEVARQAGAGADFVKAALITADVLPAAQAEAARHGIGVFGHLRPGVDVRAASRAGFRSIEHVGPGLRAIAGCSCAEAQVLAEQPAGPRIPLPPVRLPFMDRLVGRIVAKAVVNPSLRTSPESVSRACRGGAGPRVGPAVRRGRHLELPHARPRQDPGSSARARSSPPTRPPLHDAGHAEDLAEDGRPVRHGLHHGAARDLRGTLGDAAAADPDPRRGGRRPARGHRRRGRGVGRPGRVPARRVRPARRGRPEPVADPADRHVGTRPLPGPRGHRRNGRRGQERDLVLLDADPTAAVANLHAVSGLVSRGLALAAADPAAAKDDLQGRVD